MATDADAVVYLMLVSDHQGWSRRFLPGDIRGGVGGSPCLVTASRSTGSIISIDSL